MVDQATPLGSAVVRAPGVPAPVAPKQLRGEKTGTTEAPNPIQEKQSAQSPKPSPVEVKEAVEEIKDFLSKSKGNLELLQEAKGPSTVYSDLAFQVDKDTGIAFFKVIDANTRKVIRQIPSEEVLAMARKLRELSSNKDAAGVLMNEEG